VLRLSVGTHDAVVAADAEVVLGRHATRVVERLLAGEHHRTVRGHHEDALGVHQHGGFGVPVGLGADVDAGHDHVDLPTPLRELDDRAQHPGDPSMFSVPESIAIRAPEDTANHSIGAPRSRCQVDGLADQGALGGGDRAEPLGGVAEQRHPRHALRVAVGRVVTSPTTMPARFPPKGRWTGTSRPDPSRSYSTKPPASAVGVAARSLVSSGTSS
jgi:hypothetical protein